jgi:RNA polymerase sigma-70 factor (ECF subfamily)
MDEEKNKFENYKDEDILMMSLENPSLFEVLVSKYRDSFIRTSYRVLNSHEEAEDSAQDAFVKIYFNAKKFQKRQGVEFKSWAYKILLNCTFSRYRKQKKRHGDAEYQDALLYLTSGENIDYTFEKKETREEIESILKRMPEDLAELLKEHYLSDRSYNEIAQNKAISVNALKMKLFRARKSFKSIIDNKS